MRGRRVLMESFVSHGVRHIFGNPGTTETPLLDSLPAFPQLEYIMALHEASPSAPPVSTRRRRGASPLPICTSLPALATASARSTAR